MAIFSWLPTKYKVRINTETHRKKIVYIAFTKRSHIIHCAFTVSFALPLRSAIAHRSPFISVYQIPFSVLSPFTYRSSWKVKRFRDCIFLCSYLLWFIMVLEKMFENRPPLEINSHYNLYLPMSVKKIYILNMCGSYLMFNKGFFFSWKLMWNILSLLSGVSPFENSIVSSVPLFVKNLFLQRPAVCFLCLYTFQWRLFLRTILLISNKRGT